MEQHRRVRWPAVVGWALALSVLASPAAATSASAATMKWDTPGVYQWVVPADITTVTFDLYGGSGGDAGASKGGHGGHSVATFAVTPGETLSITVGGAGAAPGAGGSYGGGGLWGVAGQCAGFACYGAGGGGASDVRQGGTAATNRVLVAGGGGGAGGPSSQACGNGGCADSVGGGDGADGGALSAGRGSDGATYIVENPPPGLLPGGGCGGGGGTQSAAGTNPGDGNTTCHGPSQNTHDGFQELGGPGGDGASGAGSGGGGAGGYFGGAGGSGGGTTSSGKPSGGNNGGGGGGGGGGSGFAIPAATGVTITGGQQLGDGTALVTYGAAPATHTLSVTESGPGSVASSPAGIDCGATCTHAFDEGTAVTLTATPGAAATFSGWSGVCSGTGACTTTMSADRAVGASFASTSSPPPSPQQHPLTVTESGPGSVTSSPAGIDCAATCTHAFDEGTAVTLTPTPGPGATFGGWSGACSGTGACTVTMSAAEAVTATFSGPARRAPGRPDTKIKYARVSSANHRATFGFVGLGGVAPRSFLCKLDRRGRFHACSSPLTYRNLKPGKHTFEVKAVDSRGKADRTPATKRFGI